MLKLKLLQINNILQNICISDSKKSAGLHIFQFLYNWRTSYKFNQYTILNKIHKKKKKLNKKSNKKRNISVFKFFNIFTKNSQNDAYIYIYF